MTTNSTGRMNRISGTVMIAGRRAAFSSARIMRSLRNSADSTRSAEASGVPYFSVWIMVVTTPRTGSSCDARGEVLERLAPLGEEAKLDRGQRELVAEFGIGLAQFARDAAEGGVDGEARLGADHQQIERVGQALADRDRCAW